jgi:hypothetical protein
MLSLAPAGAVLLAAVLLAAVLSAALLLAAGCWLLRCWQWQWQWQWRDDKLDQKSFFWSHDLDQNARLVLESSTSAPSLE